MARREGPNFEMTIHEPYKIEKTGNDEEDTKNITLKINQIMEKIIIKSTSCWKYLFLESNIKLHCAHKIL